MVARVLSSTLGVVFLAAALGKVLMVDAFAATIAGIVFVPPRAGFILGVGIICIEALGAIALFANYRVRAVSLAFCVVVAVFIWVLASAIIQGKEIVCNCFGILGINLTNRQELLLDIVLFNTLGILAYIVQDRKQTAAAVRGAVHRGWTIALLLLLVFLQCSMVFALLDGANALYALNTGQAIRYAERADPEFAASSAGTRTLLLMRFSDMSCPLCTDDFFFLVDSLRSSVGNRSHRVVALFKREASLQMDPSDHLQQWVDANGFPFPAFVAPDSVSDSIHIAKSAVVVIDVKDKVLLYERFPIGLTKRLMALQLLRM